MKTLFYVLAFSLTAAISGAHELDQHARAVVSPAPAYPARGPYEPEEGIVSVLMDVDAKGDAKVVRVMCSSSYRFAEAARVAVTKWKFSAAKREGKPSRDSLEFIMIFSPTKEVEIVGPLYEI